jgi:hypothetical protein
MSGSRCSPFPEAVAKSYEVKRKRGRDDIQQRIAKQEKWSPSVCASSQSEACGEVPEPEEGRESVWNLKGLRDFEISTKATGMGCTCSAAPYPVRLDAWPQGHC